ncbi:MAG: transposase [Duncaniella sp.]|nr:transposase [Duncaniella sp.]
MVRRKENMCFKIISSDAASGSKDPDILEDSVVRFSSRWASKGYPEPLRMIRYHSVEKDEIFSFLTNHLSMPASLVAAAYRNRWLIEVFFKWVKQHLNIETFYGRSANAVSLQIYTAVITYCMVARLANQFSLRCSNYELLRALGISLTERIHLVDWIKSFQTGVLPAKSEFWGQSLFD